MIAVHAHGNTLYIYYTRADLAENIFNPDVRQYPHVTWSEERYWSEARAYDRPSLRGRHFKFNTNNEIEWSDP